MQGPSDYASVVFENGSGALFATFSVIVTKDGKDNLVLDKILLN